MKDFNDLSGPWTGWSIQNGIRISEAILLTISAGHILGSGSDMDGEFELVGHYSARDHQVTLTRRYSYTTEPSQSGVGLPYDYSGKWDGDLVSGTWESRSHPWDMNGPFEMWPAQEDIQLEYRIESEELALSSR